MDLTLVRHGKSMSNKKDLISGAGIDSLLSEEGIIHAQKVSAVFDESQFDAAFASPLKRAVLTAEILTKGKMEIIKDKRIEEIHFGAWEAKEPEPLRQQFPDAFDYMGMLNENFSNYAPDSESYPELIARVTNFLDYLKQEYADKKVLVVCHGLTIRGFYSAIFKNDMYDFVNVGNVTMNEISLDENDDFRPRMKSFNRDLVLPE